MIDVTAIEQAVRETRTKAAQNLPSDWDDSTNSRNDWLAYAQTHLGRASEKHAANEAYDPASEVIKAIGLLYDGLLSGQFD